MSGLIKGEMMKRMRFLAFTAMALTALIGVSSASAATKFTASSAGLKLVETTLETHTFTVNGSQVKCSNVTFTGTTEAKEDTEVMVTPKYEECVAFGFAATVTNENCTYNLTISGTVHIEPVAPFASCRLVIRVNNVFAQCTVTIGDQTFVFGSQFTNTTNDIHIKFTEPGVHAEVAVSTGLCPLKVGTYNNATYAGLSTVQAEGGTTTVD